jgi:lipooligosaccharide transport system ATP-binding protein
MSSIILNAENLYKNYNGKEVVNNVSLQIHQGEIVGLLGPNGAGKSTTVGMLYGAVIPSQGKVTIKGLHLSDDAKQAKKHVGIVPQDDSVEPAFTVYENIYNFAYYHTIRGARAHDRTLSLLEQFGLLEYRDHAIGALSGGYKRRVTLARAMIHNPELLFLDEPTTGLDPHIRQDFWRIIGSMKSESRGILLTTHYMDEAERLCTRILLMQHGSLIDSGTPSEIIRKYIGDQVFEIEGIPREVLESLALLKDHPILPVGSAFVISPDTTRREELLLKLQSLNPCRLEVRKPNLDDMFIKITGEAL